MNSGTQLLREQMSLADIEDAPLGLDEYQSFTGATDQKSGTGYDGLGFMLLGLFGETGSLLSALKKKQRDEDSYIAYQDEVLEELGDALWYFSNAADRSGFKLTHITKELHVGIDQESIEYEGEENATTFVQLQKRKEFDEPQSGALVEKSLLMLAGKVGRLLDEFHSLPKDNRSFFQGHLVAIFRALIHSANVAGVSLAEAATRNINKSFSRWPQEKIWGELFDDNFDEDEQLPRIIEMEIREKTDGDKTYVIQKCNGIKIGDKLTDNRNKEDDYRFHDVFHLAYAAKLGWSPVLRALFKVKRKSNPRTDENEDGARAVIIEEGIATWIFNHGLHNNNFRNVKKLDYPLLKAVHELVKGYEVEERPLWQWEEAILEGFRIFRELVNHRRGIVIVNLHERSVSFKQLEKNKKDAL